VIPPFLDTSALVKRYDPHEPGGSEVRALLEGAKAVLVSSLAIVEAVSAFRIKERQGVFTPEEVHLAVEALEAHAALQYRSVPPRPPVLREAKRLLLRHKLRAYDALHLATALVVARVGGLHPQELPFWTADEEQAKAAEAEGLAVRRV
jgi:predicted nucleic acid-binding protein